MARVFCQMVYMAYETAPVREAVQLQVLFLYSIYKIYQMSALYTHIVFQMMHVLESMQLQVLSLYSIYIRHIRWVHCIHTQYFRWCMCGKPCSYGCSLYILYIRYI